MAANRRSTYNVSFETIWGSDDRNEADGSRPVVGYQKNHPPTEPSPITHKEKFLRCCYPRLRNMVRANLYERPGWMRKLVKKRLGDFD